MHEPPGYPGSKIHPGKLVGGFSPTQLKQMLVKMGIFPNFGDESKNIWKSPLWEIDMDLIRKLQQFSH